MRVECYVKDCHREAECSTPEYDAYNRVLVTRDYCKDHAKPSKKDENEKR